MSNQQAPGSRKRKKENPLEQELKLFFISYDRKLDFEEIREKLIAEGGLEEIIKEPAKLNQMQLRHLESILQKNGIERVFPHSEDFFQKIKMLHSSSILLARQSQSITENPLPVAQVSKRGRKPKNYYLMQNQVQQPPN